MESITEEQLNSLTQEIHRLTELYQKEEYVECIYFLPYTITQKKCLDLIVVVDDTVVISELEGLVKDDNLEYSFPQSIEKFGGRLRIVFNPSVYYLSGIETRRPRDLYNSEILYDPNHVYSDIANKFDETGSSKKFMNLLDINIDRSR